MAQYLQTRISMALPAIKGGNVPSESPGRVIAQSKVGYSGWLRKLKVHPPADGQPIKSSWHKRHFRTAGGFLAYYKNEESQSPAGWLRLAQISEVRCLAESEVAAGVSPSGMPAATVRVQLVHRVLFLGTKSAEDAEGWRSAIQQGVDLARGVVPGASPSPRLAGRVRGGFEPRSPAASIIGTKHAPRTDPRTAPFVSPGGVQFGLGSVSKPPSKRALVGHGDSAAPAPRLAGSRGRAGDESPSQEGSSRPAASDHPETDLAVGERTGSEAGAPGGARRALHSKTHPDSPAAATAVDQSIPAGTPSPVASDGGRRGLHVEAPTTPAGAAGGAGGPPTLEDAMRSTTSGAPVGGTAVAGPDGSVWIQAEYVRSIDPASGHFYLTGVTDGVAHWSLPPETRGAHWGGWVTVWDEVTASLYYLHAESGETSFLSPGADSWYAPAPQQVQAWPGQVYRQQGGAAAGTSAAEPGGMHTSGHSGDDSQPGAGDFQPPTLDMGAGGGGGQWGHGGYGGPAALLTTSTDMPAGGIDFSGGASHRAREAAEVAAAQRGEEGYGPYGAGAGGAGGEGAAQSVRGEDVYAEAWDDTYGHPYYVRIATGVAQWEAPTHPGAVVIRQGGGEEAGPVSAGLGAAGGMDSAGSAPASVHAPSPSGPSAAGGGGTPRTNVATALASLSQRGALRESSQEGSADGAKSVLSPPPPPATGFPARTPAGPR